MAAWGGHGQGSHRGSFREENNQPREGTAVLLFSVQGNCLTQQVVPKRVPTVIWKCPPYLCCHWGGHAVSRLEALKFTGLPVAE